MVKPKLKNLMLTGVTVAFFMSLACFPVMAAYSRRMAVTYHWHYHGKYLAGSYAGYRYDDSSYVLWQMTTKIIPETGDLTWPQMDVFVDCETIKNFEWLNDIIVHYEYRVIEWPGHAFPSDYEVYIFKYGIGGGWEQIAHGSTTFSKTGSVSIQSKFGTLQNYYKEVSGELWCKVRLYVITSPGNGWFHDVYIDQLTASVNYS